MTRSNNTTNVLWCYWLLYVHHIVVASPTFSNVVIDNAPLTKLIALSTGLATFLLPSLGLRKALELSSLDQLTKNYQLWRLFTNNIFFSSTLEAVLGIMLLYHFRLFERQMGPVKFAVCSPLLNILSLQYSYNVHTIFIQSLYSISHFILLFFLSSLSPVHPFLLLESCMF